MYIGVFCASADHIQEAYFRDAAALGEGIARRGWNLVYGGTNCGLMHKTAEAVLAHGGKAVGVIPECIQIKGVAAEGITELLTAPDMKERKQLMRERADAFIALPGGWGTLEEITEVITLKQLGNHSKPIVFVNTNGFYDKFFEFIENCKKEGFISKAYDGLYMVADRVESVFGYLENYKEKHVVSKYA